MEPLKLEICFRWFSGLQWIGWFLGFQPFIFRGGKSFGRWFVSHFSGFHGNFHGQLGDLFLKMEIWKMIPFSLGEGHRRFRKSPGRSDGEIRTQPWQVRTRRKVHLGRGTARGCACGWLAVNKQKDPFSPPKNWGVMPKCTRRRICTSTFFVLHKNPLTENIKMHPLRKLIESLGRFCLTNMTWVKCWRWWNVIQESSGIHSGKLT